jgi:type I restriction enzyme S subunit
MSEAWPETTLGSVARVRRDRLDPSQLGEALLIHYSIPVLDETGRPVTEPASGIGSQKFRVISDAVLVSLLNPRIPRVWLAQGGEATVCSTEFAVLVPTDERQLTLGFLHFWCQSPPFWKALQGRAVGTTGSRQRAKAEGLLSIPMFLPSLDEQRRIVDLIGALDVQVEALDAEVGALRQSRVALLTSLLSGQVTIPESYDRS